MWRRLLTGLVIVGSVLGVVVIPVACGYIALPGGWIVNFPGFTGESLADSQLRQRITLPPGFSITAYVGGIENARFLLFTQAGDLLVSAPRQGKVFLAERDAAGTGSSRRQRVLLDNLYQPHGLAFRDGWLYVAETTPCCAYASTRRRARVGGAPERIIRGLPDGGNHWTRTIHIGPDGKLYVSIGSSCNACIEDDKRRAAILRFNLDGSGGELYATGLRNAVDFDWQPGSGDLYATDNGRDLLGDDFPPCEFNRVVQGGFYGWPFANGERVPDPDYGKGHEAEIAASIPPAHGFAAHVAPLGMTFYVPPAGPAPATFPPAYRGAVFVAQHGSWNRSKKSGYKVVALHVRPDGTITEEPFATGFMVEEHVSGRPVDVAVGPDGALYVSDDFTASVYRIAYGQAAQAGAAPPARATAAHDPLASLSPPEIEVASARGAALWAANACASCHLASQAAPEAYRPLTGLRSSYSIESLAALLRTPPPPMPVFALSDMQRRDLAVYLLATHP